MIAVIFGGPSLAADDVALPEGFMRLPPAGQGDVFRAAKARPRAIGLIDGYFEGVPSVWHKEILWALTNGIAVYGSASMGALRAAELAPFGMIGVGRIFESYRDGTIEADDEVALLHGPAEADFTPLTEPLVNVRATCDAAAAAGVLTDDEAQATIRAAQAIFYKERTWRAIGAKLRASAFPGDRLAALEAWLRQGRVDQKRLDAVAMLGHMEADLTTGSFEAPPAWTFEETYLWQRAVSSWKARQHPFARSRGLGSRETLYGLLASELLYSRDEEEDDAS